MNNKLSFIPLGGAVDVTKNMYLYEYGDSILIVDCGLGFANEEMIGVDLIIPDITYLLNSIQSGKKIVGMLLTHGHEDHIGGLPYLLPQMPTDFEIFAPPFAAALVNAKIKDFGLQRNVKAVDFDKDYQFGPFNASFIRITHSVPDTSNIFIKTPVGNFYHGSDFKLDDTPFDGKLTDYEKIKKLSSEGVLCLMSDTLGAEKMGFSISETTLTPLIEEEMAQTIGKFVFTTYSSNIARLNQVILAAKKLNKQICFVGRSLIKAVDTAKALGYIKIDSGMEVELKGLNRVPDPKLVLIVAGAQGQEGSALSRIVNGTVAEITLNPKDTVVFSSDPIPGNELSVYALIDAISKIGSKVIYSDVPPSLHVSGHGPSGDLMRMVDLVKPKNVLPIGSTFRHMAAYKKLVKQKGYQDSNILLLDDGQEVVFENGTSHLGRKIEVNNVYVDQISGEEVESFVLRDREKISKDGIVVVIAEINSSNGQILNSNIIARGFLPSETQKLTGGMMGEIRKELARGNNRIKDWNHLRKSIGNISERFILKRLKRRPLVLPIVIEV